MKAERKSFLQIILLVGFVIILIRLFPIFIRLIEVAAFDLIRFWWVVLILALLGWLVYVLRKRNPG
jgi:hypothetical protein